MTRAKEITKEADKVASANTQIIEDWGEHYLGFIHGAEWADQHPHWISVKDELPKEEGWILICSYRDVDMWYYNGQTAKDLMDYASITHWMHLPQPPESGNNSKEGGEA